MRRKKKIPRMTNMEKSSWFRVGFIPYGQGGKYRKCMDLITNGKYEQAEGLLIQYCIDYRDGNSMFGLLLADVLYLQKKLDLAEKLYRELVVECLALAHPHYGLALVLIETNRREEAEARNHIKMAKSNIGHDTIPEHLPPLH